MNLFTKSLVVRIPKEYEVLGEDGNLYIGTYGRGLIGNSFFRTKEDHISVLMRRINNNEQEISKLKEKNNIYVREINNLEESLRNSNYIKRLSLIKKSNS